MKSNLYLIVIPLFCAVCAQAQQRSSITVRGLIMDKDTGETLIGATAVSDEKGVVTNDFGFYSLTLPATQKRVTYSCLGYQSSTLLIDSPKDTVIDIALVLNKTALEESVIVAQSEYEIHGVGTGAINIPKPIVKSMPALFGEPDVLKTLQLLPGVQAGLEGLSGIHIRGGGPDESILLLDGIPVYNASHLLGIVSVFQPEAVKKITLYKGYSPAIYSGRISGVVDVRTNDGNLFETHGCYGVSMLSDKFHLEGPIWKERTTYSVSLRGLHTLFLAPLLKLAKLDGNYLFYDFDAKITHRVDNRNKLYINVYNGMDDFYYRNHGEYENTALEIKAFDSNRIGIRWGNTVMALRWNSIVSGKLFCNTTLAYNRYNMVMETEMSFGERKNGETMNRDLYGFDYHSGMQDYSIRSEFDYYSSPKHHLTCGVNYTHHSFIPETMTNTVNQIKDSAVQADTTWCTNTAARQTGHEMGFYAQEEIHVGSHMNLNVGVHASFFNTQGKTYFSPEPRINANIEIARDWNVGIAYSQMTQYVHLLSSSDISLPINLWVPITSAIPPETANQYELGAKYRGIKGWLFSLDSYYKDINNIIEYKDGVSFMFNSDSWENKVETGRGYSMGIELLIEKTRGNTTGWLGYTLSKSERIFPTINGGETFPYRYDRRHKINLVVNHRISEILDVGLTWAYVSGGAITLSEHSIMTISPTGELFEQDYISSRNNFRLPASHMLNIGINYHQRRKRGEGLWHLNIYNVYNRMNPNLVVRDRYSYTDKRYDEGGKYAGEEYIMKNRLVKLTILPFFPSVGYTRSF